jgi:plasmid stabilization system protein ParE
VFHRLAAEEYRRARRWYARRSAALAARFRDAVDQVVVRMATAPDQGGLFGGAYRWTRTRRFPYILYYLAEPGQITVLAVAHSSRRQGYWLRRRP